MDEDWGAIFGETPGANAYDRQVRELRGIAQQAADSAKRSELCCKRATDIAESIKASQARAERQTGAIRICTWVIVACCVIVAVIEVARLAWQ